MTRNNFLRRRHGQVQAIAEPPPAPPAHQHHADRTHQETYVLNWALQPSESKTGPLRGSTILAYDFPNRLYIGRKPTPNHPYLAILTPATDNTPARLKFQEVYVRPKQQPIETDVTLPRTATEIKHQLVTSHLPPAIAYAIFTITF
jgi:hypothetical protein